MTVHTKERVRERVKERGRRPRREATAQRSVTEVSRVILFVFGLIGLVGSLHLLVMIGVEAGRYNENTREIDRLRGDIGELERELDSLRAVLDHARDARYREHLARRQGFAYPDERRLFTLAPEAPSALSQESD